MVIIWSKIIKKYMCSKLCGGSRVLFTTFTIKLKAKFNLKKSKIEIYANKTLINCQRIDVLSGSENLYEYFNYNFFWLSIKSDP